MQPVKLLVVIAACALAAWGAAATGLHGPMTGFVVDTQGLAIRPMLGLPGAAYLGAPVITDFAAASVSPDGSQALIAYADRLVRYTGLRGGSPTSLVVPGAIPGADRFAWSPDSTVAAIYSSARRQVQILPRAAPPLTFANLPGQVTAMAFDGTHVVIAPESGGIYLTQPETQPVRIASAANPSALALAGPDLYFADAKTQQIWQIQNYAHAAAPVVFAHDSRMQSLVGLQASADSTRLYAADAGNRTLTVYDIASRTVTQTLRLNFTPTRLDRFGDPSVYLMNAAPPGPFQVLSDRDPAHIAVFFIPSAPLARPHPTVIHRD